MTHLRKAELAHFAQAEQRAQEHEADAIARIKASLGERVSDVKVSTRLTSSASCLVAGSQGPDRELERLLAMQNRDGGWGQEQGLASDAFATGQALYFLSLAGVKNGRAEVQRAVSFLVARQKEDGSWPMTSRAHPGAKPFTSPVPITYFGSAWATLGLLRSVPE